MAVAHSRRAYYNGPKLDRKWTKC